MKKKLNWVSVGNMVGLLSGSYYILHTLYVLCILPFINNKMVSLTPYGLFTLIVALLVVASNFRYFEERLSL